MWNLRVIEHGPLEMLTLQVEGYSPMSQAVNAILDVCCLFKYHCSRAAQTHFILLAHSRCGSKKRVAGGISKMIEKEPSIVAKWSALSTQQMLM